MAVDPLYFRKSKLTSRGLGADKPFIFTAFEDDHAVETTLGNCVVNEKL